MFNQYLKKTHNFIYLFIFFISMSTFSAYSMEKEIKPKKYLPVILVSGIAADDNGMNPLIEMIKQNISPDMYVKHYIIGTGKISSFKPVKSQAKELAQDIFNDPELRDGFNILAHSQGGLLARYFVERYNNPPVYNYIALGSPQRGVSGIPGDLDEQYPSFEWAEKEAYEILYTKAAQKLVSFAGYWNDSLHHDEYLQYCSFLPYLNNEKEHKHAALYKENICKLHNMVLVQSTQENIVEPKESCHFGYYKNGSKTEFESLFESEIYQNDTLGLRTLYESGRLHLKEAHCLHTDYQEDRDNFRDNVVLYLLIEKQKKKENLKKNRKARKSIEYISLKLKNHTENK